VTLEGYNVRRLRKESIVCGCRRRQRVGSARAAFDGIVIAHNEALERKPGLLNRDPFGAGWMLIVRPFRDDWCDCLVTGMPLYVVATDGHPLSRPGKIAEFFSGPASGSTRLRLGRRPADTRCGRFTFKTMLGRSPPRAGRWPRSCQPDPEFAGKSRAGHSGSAPCRPAQLQQPVITNSAVQ
jgi:Glycine cleavage H-protein